MHLAKAFGRVLGLLSVVPFVAALDLSCEDNYDANNKVLDISCRATDYTHPLGVAYSSCIIRHQHRYCRLIRNWKEGKFDKPRSR